MHTTSAPGAAAESLADKLNKLYENMATIQGRRVLSDLAVSKGIEEELGVEISHQYLNFLRTGKKKNPSTDKLKAIATYFGVSVSYLVEGPDESIDAQLNLVRSMREAGVVDIATRLLNDLTPEAINTLAEVLDRVKEHKAKLRPEENK